MRVIDRRAQFSRRGFLRTTAAGIPAAALVAAGATISPTAAWAEAAKALKPRSMATLVRMARDIYPHDFLGDGYYVNAVTPWDGKAGEDATVKAMIEDGVATLDTTAQSRFGTGYLETAWEEQRVAVLQGIESSAFFRKVQGDLVVSLYNQHDLWAKFGYEGSSAEHGGYIHRGFDDIDWLAQA